MKKNIKLHIFFLLFFTNLSSYSQVGINTSTPNTESILDITSTNMGVLIPRVALSATNIPAPLSAHVAGMKVYNTATTGGFNLYNVLPGEYYNDGTKWIRISEDYGVEDLDILGSNNHITQDAGVGGNGDSLGTGINNIGIGYHTFFSNTTGSDNFAVGTNALAFNSSGSNLVAIGGHSLFKNTFGNFNTAVGSQVLYYNTIGSFNASCGYGSLYNNISGSNNTSLGMHSLLFNIAGNNNCAVGFGSLFNNINGNYNSAFGVYSSRFIDSGSSNTIFGYDTSFSLTSGSKNTFLGYKTAYGISIGNSNTVIGGNVSGLASNLSNNIIISDGDGNSRINVVTNGNVGFGTNAPTSKLQVVGLPVYANNAAAIASGLTIGAFYHIGDGVLRVVY